MQCLQRNYLSLMAMDIELQASLVHSMKQQTWFYSAEHLVSTSYLLISNSSLLKDIFGSFSSLCSIEDLPTGTLISFSSHEFGCLASHLFVFVLHDVCALTVLKTNVSENTFLESEETSDGADKCCCRFLSFCDDLSLRFKDEASDSVRVLVVSFSFFCLLHHLLHFLSQLFLQKPRTKK